MKKIKEIINSDWLNLIAAVVVALGFSLYGHWFVAGIATGFGIKNFINFFKIPEISSKCLCDCETCDKCEY